MFSGNPRRLGVSLAFSGMLLVSLDSLLTRAARASGWEVAFWFGVFTTMTMTVVLFRRGIEPAMAELRPWLRPTVVLGALQAVSTTAFIIAVTRTTIANVVVIIAAAPVFAAGLSWLVIRERTSARVWRAIALSIFGIGIVIAGSARGVGPSTSGTSGDLFAIAAIAAFAMSLTLLRRHPDVSRPWVVGLAGLFVAVVAAIPANIFGHSTRTYVLLAIMGIVTGPAGRVALSSATRFLTASEVSLFTPVETVAASFWAWLAFDETPGSSTYVGGAIVLAAVLYAFWTPRSLRADRLTGPG